MKIQRCLTVISITVLTQILFSPAHAQRSQLTGNAPRAVALSSVPLSFELNQGQTDGTVKYLTRGNGYDLFLTPDEAIFQLHPLSDQAVPSVLRMRFVGASPTAQVSGAEKLSGTINYFIGQDPKKWHSGISTFSKVDYLGIYPGIDAVFYGNQRELEYDFTVNPGADPARISMAFTGANPRIDRSGNIRLSLGGENILLHKPILYQGAGTHKKSVDGRYLVAGHRVTLQVGPYDHRQALVIDPVISYLTYLGGSTGTSGNVAVTSISCRPNACPPGFSWQRGQGMVVDSSGNTYITGLTYAVDFPTKNPFQATNKSATQWTAYVTKMNATGTGLVYSTYLGGTGWDEADAIAIDGKGSAYVIGATMSGDFPTTPGAFISKCPVQSSGPPAITYCQTNGASFLTKLSPDGQSLVYSTYVTTLENAGTIRDVAVDSKGRAYISGDNTTYGDSRSSNPPSTFFPTTSNALLSSSLLDQALYPGTGNPGMAFLTVFSADGSSLVYSTLYGDSDPVANINKTAGYTRAVGVAVDPVGNFYVAGFTADPNIPVTPSAFQKTLSRANATQYRGFIAKFSSVDGTEGPQFVYGTYLGGTATNANDGDYVAGIVGDASGSAYVSGATSSADFPTTPDSYNPTCLAASEGYCENAAFLTKIKPDGSGLAWSTYVDYANGFNGITAIVPPRLDARGNVYVEVQTSLGYPVLNPVQTPSGNTQLLGITKFDPTGSRIFFSTLLGSPTGSGAYGTSVQFPAGVDVDPQGNIYVAGMTDEGDLPTTAGAFEPNFPLKSQNWTGFLAKLNPFVVNTTSLVVAPNYVSIGENVTFTATVNTNEKGTATGTVDFLNGTDVIGTGVLDASDTATFSTSALPAGTYSITAAYLGDDTFAGSLSTAKSLKISASAIITSPSPGSTLAGSTVTFTWSSVATATEYILYVGTTPGAKDIASVNTGTKTSVMVSAIPVSGKTLYVTLYSKIGGQLESNAYTYLEAAGIAASMISPTPGSTLNGSSAMFTWTSGTNVTDYIVYVGSTPGAKDIAGVNAGTKTSATVSGIPVTGKTLYVTLFSKIGTQLQSKSYTYTEAAGIAASMTSPTPGSTLNGASVTFTWTSGTNVTEYVLYVGTTAGAKDIAAISTSTNTSATVTNIPVVSNPVYVTLYSKIGSQLQSKSYTYTEAAGNPATMISPTPGTTLSSSSVTFTWTSGTNVSEYILYVGTTAGAKDIASINAGTQTSANVTAIPSEGATVYVTLYSMIAGKLKANAYTYTEP